ncbi:stage II sporulation protein M [Pseudoclavibacter terrae]|uniref:Stage II sporulation protein M n=1 Tax=Pseudoclavibacter terrae TaxID=1530195 RepID=A0A7J5AZV6_9MICO|nr:stage II sporulation protein M [Pseudoclavibacter terrae]KAB1636171.1 stage II sporulation protein M [Pseudoclavibacter terrae]
MTSAPVRTKQHSHLPRWRHPVRLIRDNARAYILLNIAAYGLTAVGFVLGIVFPGLQAARVDALEGDGTAGLVQDLVLTPPLFALVILAVNIGKVGLGFIILPSLVVPFAGLGLFAYFAVETGITLAPTSPIAWVQLIPHSLTLIIELQAYILLLLGAWLLGRCWILPRTVGAPNRRRGYLRGLRSMAVLAVPALALLIVGAIWEAYSLRYLIHPLAEWLL